MNFGNVDFSQVEAASTFEPLPAGTYHCRYLKDEPRQSRSSGDTYLSATYVVVDGPYAKRQIFDRYLIWNKNPTCQRIHLGKIKAIGLAVGVPNPSDSGQFWGKELLLKVALRTDDQGNQQNEVKGYLPLTHAAAFAQPTPPAAPALAAAPNAAAPAAPTSAPSSSDMPW